MGVDVTVKSKGLFKKNLTIDDILNDDMRFGVMDESFRLEEGMTGEYTVIFNRKNVCRGCEVSFKKGKVDLRLPLPTSDADVYFFYDVIKQVCNKMNTNIFTRDEEEVSLDDIDNCIKEDIKTSTSALKKMEENINDGSSENLYIFGAMNPVTLGSIEMKNIKGSTIKFGILMNSLQTMDVYYAAPKIYQNNDSSYFGVFALTEGVASVLPDKPKLLINENKIDVSEWQIGLVVGDEVQGFISYDDFLKSVKRDSRYDSEHFIITIDKGKINKLISKYKIDL